MSAGRRETPLMQSSPNSSISAGGIVVNPRGEIVIVQQKSGNYSLPKGYVERGESPLQAAIREIVEETGIDDLMAHGSEPLST